MDFYKDKYISIDTRQSYPEISLLVNGTFYDTTHSSAIMDHEGRIYYFKQKKDMRTLYRDKAPIFSFKSYYSYPVEADSEGVYFIGATEYGSSLFVYKEDKGIFRLSLLDTISYARKIKEGEFLVSEITPTQYEYKIIQTEEFAEQPVLYAYSFQKENIFENETTYMTANEIELESSFENETKILSEDHEDQELNVTHFVDSVLKKDSGSTNKEFLVKDNSTTQDSSPKIKNTFFPTQIPIQQIKHHRAYNSLKMLSLENISFLLFIDIPFYELNSKINWQDPLKYNKLRAHTALGSQQYFASKLLYGYNKYRLSLDMAVSYNQKLIDGSENIEQIKSLIDVGLLNKKDFGTFDNISDIKNFSAVKRNRAVEMGFEYPFVIKNYWKLSWIQSGKWGQLQLNQNPLYLSKHLPVLWFKSQPWKNYFEHSGGINFNFERKYKYAYYFYKKKSFNALL